MKDMTFSITQNGSKKEYKIIKIIPSIKMNKDYIIYRDDDDIYASRYEINNNNIKLFEIEDDSEYDYLDSILRKDSELYE